MNSEVFHTIDQSGPGIWFVIHLSAVKATTRDTKKAFRILIAELVDNFPCDECKKHFQEYVMKNPLEEVEDYFYWTWVLHNQVNVRNGKEVVSYRQAKKFYDTLHEKPCTACKMKKEELFELPE